MEMIPADNVLDVTGRPERFPSLIIGEAQTIYRRWDATVNATLHVWFEENALVKAKLAASAIVDALYHDAQVAGSVIQTEHFSVFDMAVDSTRFLRDLHGPFSHGVVNVAAIMRER